MSSPLDHLMNWYSDLAPDQRQDVAFLVGTMMPGVAIEIDSEDIASAFAHEIQRLNTNSRRQYGLALCLRTTIEHIIIDRRSDSYRWNDTKSTLRELAERTGKEKFNDQADQIDFRAAQWKSSCKKWRDMAAVHLTDANLTRYYVESVKRS